MKLKLHHNRKLQQKFYLIPLVVLIGIFTAFRQPIIRTGANAYSDIRRFIEVVNVVRDYYVDEVDPKSLVDGAINGLLGKLDPHSVYIPADRVAQIDEKIVGSYAGIGVDFVIQDKYPVIVAPFPDSPAQRLRLRSGDIIKKIGTVSTYGLSDGEIKALLRGEIGSMVRLTIKRPDFAEMLVFNVIRDRIPLQSVQCYYMIDREIGYIKLGRFARTTSDEVNHALSELEKKGLKKLIFDLRDNGGGYLDQAVAVTDLFLPGGRKIVYTKGRIPTANEEFYSTSTAQLRKYPLVVLINGGTASAAEVMAAALQDWDRAVIVGKRSFGKGLVQNQVALQDGAELRVTVARYFSPSGRLIQRPFGPNFREYFKNKSGEKSYREYTNKKVYTTFSGRKVYGGGGIKPDVEQDSYQISSATVKLEARMLFFEFASLYVKEIKQHYSEFGSFLKNYKIENNVLRQFWSFLRQKNIYYIDRQIPYVQQEIKSEIARQIWGNAQYFRVRLETDSQFHAAIASFPMAERFAVLSLGVR